MKRQNPVDFRQTSKVFEDFGSLLYYGENFMLPASMFHSRIKSLPSKK
jgi:hypothetical protein